MTYENINTPEVQETVAPAQEVKQNKPEASASGLSSVKFFGNCSRSLKRFSIILFIINIFVAIGLTGALVISLFFKVGLDMLGFLAFPIVVVFIVLLIIARFISALIYGFAEIVEKYEKK